MIFANKNNPYVNITGYNKKKYNRKSKYSSILIKGSRCYEMVARKRRWCARRARAQRSKIKLLRHVN